MDLARAWHPCVALLAALALSGGSRGTSASEAPPVLIAGVEITGHESLSSREVAGILAPDRDRVFDPVRLAARADSLLARLAAAGHPFARVTIDWGEGPSGVRLAVAVDEGPRVRLAEVAIEGVRSIDLAEFVRGMDARPGTPLERAALERDIGELLGRYADRGRPLARVAPASAAVTEEGAVVRLSVDEGPEVRFSGLSVTGRRVTKEHVVVRESGIVPGRLYSATDVARLVPRLERLAIFRSVSNPVVTFDRAAGEAAVSVEVTEGTANRISGAMGYAPGVGEEEGELSGRVEVSLRNIAGTARSASAEWSRVRRGESTISFSYLEPWVLSAPIDVGVSGAQTVRDTVSTMTEGDLSVSARMGERTRLTWGVGGQRFVPGEAGAPTTTALRTSMAARFDDTDSPWNPARGWVVGGSVVYAAKEARGTGERNRSGTFTVEGQTFLSPWAGHVIAFAAALSAVASTEDDVPFHEQLVLGGATSLRGYREEQFRGTRTALGSVEYRYLLGRRSRAIVFLDVGYYDRSGPNVEKGTKVGYGIGLRADGRLGIIGVDYGLGEGDGLLDGKLHVGLVREF